MKIYAVMTMANGEYPTCDGIALTREGAEKLAQVSLEDNWFLTPEEVKIIEFEGNDFVHFYDNKDWYWNVEEPEEKLFG